MKNWFSWVGRSIVLGSLLTGSMAVGGAIAEPSTLARSERQTIESLPNGRHIYGIQKKRQYLSFLKQNNLIYGEKNVSDTDDVVCIFGEVSGNKISNAKLAWVETNYLGNGRVRTEYRTRSVSLNFDEYRSQTGYIQLYRSSGTSLEIRDKYIDRCLSLIKKVLKISPTSSTIKPNYTSRNSSLTDSIGCLKPVTSYPTSGEEIALLDRTHGRYD